MGEASGLPKLTFIGTVHGKEMQLTLVWDNVMLIIIPSRSFCISKPVGSD